MLLYTDTAYSTKDGPVKPENLTMSNAVMPFRGGALDETRVPRNGAVVAAVTGSASVAFCIAAVAAARSAPESAAAISMYLLPIW